ncbi:MraY family glycosyltransferase [Aquirufa sp.]|jgi:UDP-GlcNAc:undecaprenyl-phosphate GlcNAc-1-phosphate transferase|uniref:MraY family glycosyltransferase n=1 Tax=Aquirufa sp. TaxID=2676249 RepID=UPI0037BF71FB
MKEYILLFENKEFQIISSLIISLIISIASIPVIINISKLKDLMAEIELRSSHEKLTPTLGGVAIFAATLISYFIWDNPYEGHEIHLAVADLIILFFLGIKDDILILSPKKKLLIQIAASILLITLGDLRINSLYGLLGISNIPYFLSIIFTTFIFISLINAINLLDGIDGLAGTVGVMASICFGYLFFNLGLFAHATLAFSLAGSLIGFLRYNWSTKNKIFMGDTGSLIVGFLLSFFAVKYIILNSDYLYNPQLGNDAPILAMLILVLPLFDTLRMFIIRLLAFKSPFEGDRNHLHHILIDQGISHMAATIILVGGNCLLLFVYFLFRPKFTNYEFIVTTILLFSTYCAVAFFLAKRIRNVDRVKFTKIDKIKRLQLMDEKKIKEQLSSEDSANY